MDGVLPFESREVALKDGRRVWLRAGGPDDAEAYRDYLLRAVPSAEGVGLFVDEVRSVEFYRERLAKYLPERGGLGLFAEPVGEQGRIVGDCGLSGFEIRKMAGVLSMGMMCDEGWRGVGLGRAMLTAALDWARANASSPLGVRRVELGVLATNPGAAALYRSVGFVEEGRYRARFRQADGSLVDDLAMAILVG
jgi:RimJ/RimL family protein N-acetyltransferase